MKKTVRKFFIMMFAIASLISCSKEDDVYAPYGFVQSAYDIQGLWLSQQEYFTFTGNTFEKYPINDKSFKNHGTFTIKNGYITFTYMYNDGTSRAENPEPIVWFKEDKTQFNIGDRYFLKLNR